MTPESSIRRILAVTAGWESPTALPMSVLVNRALRCSRSRIFQSMASNAFFDFISESSQEPLSIRRIAVKTMVFLLIRLVRAPYTDGMPLDAELRRALESAYRIALT